MNPVVQETRARRRWIAFIGMFFVAQAGLWTWAIARVSSDPSHAVVANYDARALDWDAQRALAAASAALGWESKVTVEGDALTVQVVDRDAVPVELSVVHAVLFHNAEAAHRRRVTLEAVAPGVFRAPASLHRPGKWTVEIEAARGSDVYRRTEILMVE